MSTMPSDAAALLRREAASFVERLRLFTPARWAAQAPVVGTRADVVHHLAQCFADDAATHERTRQRRLPRLDSDLVIADQLAVTVDDLVRSLEDDAAAATAATAHLLVHRRDVLGDVVPAGLAAALRLADVEAAGRRICEEIPARPS
jgi:hypothetical protein